MRRWTVACNARAQGSIPDTADRGPRLEQINGCDLVQSESDAAFDYLDSLLAER